MPLIVSAAPGRTGAASPARPAPRRPVPRRPVPDGRRGPRPRRGAPAAPSAISPTPTSTPPGSIRSARGRRLRAAGHRPRPLHGRASAAQPVRAAHGRQRVLPVLVAPPVLNMRPGYHLPLIRGPHQFSADLELLHWLEHRQIEVDVLTDDDLHTRGAAALSPYRVVLTGSHPEYYSTADARRAGRLPRRRRAADVPRRQRVLLGHDRPGGRPVPDRGAARTGGDQGVGISARRMAPGHDRGARRAVAAPGPVPAVAGRGGVHRAGIRCVPALPHRRRPRAGTGRFILDGIDPGAPLGERRLGPRRRRRDSRSTGPTRRWARRRARWSSPPPAGSATPTRARWRM